MKILILLFCLCWASLATAEEFCPSQVLEKGRLNAVFVKSSEKEGGTVFLIENEGKELEILLGRRQYPEFTGLKSGDRISLRFERRQFLRGKDCVQMTTYLNHSGKILSR